jgi:tRNA pseudouridine55 synthase
MGQTLGCGCMMTALTRTEACGFLLAQAYTFEQVQQAADAGETEQLLIPTDAL